MKDVSFVRLRVTYLVYSFCKSKCLWTSSLRANSIYILNINENFNELTSNGRIFLEKNRIRDIDYDKDLDLIILLSENVPALITIKKNLE